MMNERTLVMGVLNVTPDSFSDGGHWFGFDEAVKHAYQMLDEGADLIDIGGESTRPGADRLDCAEELRRVIPVVKELSGQCVVSVDTMRHEVAAQAIAAGARIINDVSGGLADPSMVEVIADAQVDYICQHWRGHSLTMNDLASYDDVVVQVKSELQSRVDAVIAAGVPQERIIIDPGLGFAKQGDQDWHIMAHLSEFTNMGFRVLIGASRKRFLGAVVPNSAPIERDHATAAISMWCQLNRIWAVRAHLVKPQRDAIAVAAKLQQISSFDFVR